MSSAAMKGHAGTADPVAAGDGSDARAGAATGIRVSRIKFPKAASAADCRVLEQLPNIGPSLAADLRRIGIERPADLIGRDAFALYQTLCACTGQRHDPCVLDTFMAAADFMHGAPATPWWHYTPRRKALFGAI